MECNKQKDKSSVLIFSGGGTRFGIYCGMYAALHDLGRTPDYIIASCGGAIASTIINAWSSNKERKAYLQSHELYEFIKSMQLTSEKKLNKLPLFCLKKILWRQSAPYIEDVFNKYLVDMRQDLSEVLPSLSTKANSTHRSIVIGSKMLFTHNHVKQKRGTDKLYRRILFTDEDTKELLKEQSIEILSKNYLNSAVDSATEIRSTFNPLTVLRISISDMFYIPPTYYNGENFAGGAIDLTPIEVAKALGNHIYLEQKMNYTPIEEALVRSVLGFSGNSRLKEVEEQANDSSLFTHFIDTQDATEALKTHYCRKHLNWKKGIVELTLPASFPEFVKSMEIQWEYGYQKIMNVCKK